MERKMEQKRSRREREQDTTGRLVHRKFKHLSRRERENRQTNVVGWNGTSLWARKDDEIRGVVVC
jgi:hypothetical protein